MVTDASHTAALTSAMKRRDLVPRAIAVGCDLFLFYNDPDDDMGFMRDGYRNGVITEERLTDALHAILGTKAALGLHRKKPAEIVPPAEEALARIGLPENKAVFESATDRSITLAKYTDETILPITPDRYPGCSLSPSRGRTTLQQRCSVVAGSRRGTPSPSCCEPRAMRSRCTSRRS